MSLAKAFMDAYPEDEVRKEIADGTAWWRSLGSDSLPRLWWHNRPFVWFVRAKWWFERAYWCLKEDGLL